MARRRLTRRIRRFLSEHREAVLYAVALVIGATVFLSTLHSCARQEEPPAPAGGVRVTSDRP